MKPSHQEDPHITVTKIAAWTSFGSSVAKWGTICFVVYQVANAIIAFSGQMTLADISIEVGISMVSVFFWVFAIIIGRSGYMYGVNQKRLRHNTIAHFEAEKRGQEKAIDPQRSSSGLTSDGQTPKE